MKKQIRNDFTESLIGIYKLDIIKELTAFLQGEQAVLFALNVTGTIHPSEISEKLNLTRSRTSMIISSLKTKDLINIEEDQTDRRMTNISLNEKGLKQINEKEDEALKIFDYLLDQLGEEKVKSFTTLINETVNIMKGVKNEFK